MNSKFKNIVFIGGIHGVGKSSICKEIVEVLGWQHLTASEVLKWKNISKQVENIGANQNRLISGLKNIIKPDAYYLLDGHFCLLDKSNKVSQIPESTFVDINPMALCLITDDVLSIKSRLEARDNKEYDASILSNMQVSEQHYAEQLSKKLNINLHVGTPQSYQHITNALKDI